jgi:ribonuclease BN (tRNA processing enzyme)
MKKIFLFIGILISVNSFGQSLELYLSNCSKQIDCEKCPPEDRVTYQVNKLNQVVLVSNTELKTNKTTTRSMDNCSIIDEKNFVCGKDRIVNRDDGVTVKIDYRTVISNGIYEDGITTRLIDKNGKDITLDDGRIIPNDVLTFEPIPTKSYAFCSDTMYDESIISIIKDADILYHETTFLESEADKAEKTMHSTAKQAATIARKANVKQLILGHYSTRYDNIVLFKEEAETIFSNVLLADDGKTFEFD